MKIAHMTSVWKIIIKHHHHHQGAFWQAEIRGDAMAVHCQRSTHWESWVALHGTRRHSELIQVQNQISPSTATFTNNGPWSAIKLHLCHLGHVDNNAVCSHTLASHGVFRSSDCNSPSFTSSLCQSSFDVIGTADINNCSHSLGFGWLRPKKNARFPKCSVSSWENHKSP